MISNGIHLEEYAFSDKVKAGIYDDFEIDFFEISMKWGSYQNLMRIPIDIDVWNKGKIQAQN